ncbi:hypothetical protein D0868_14418 [Hortaea werneckii]|uniref:NADH-ubiquinone oxidoreductase 14.8 kDa subunit n=1 Tax=Hortaea werneckii TaxID=91943 RepID=A0A3M6XJI5_HORWE|nr:hypothetical protein D0868_14418 [Hortaea werneckii]
MAAASGTRSATFTTRHQQAQHLDLERSEDVMVINPTYLAQRTRSSTSWSDAKTRVTKSYRDWLRASPEIQQMYSLNMPVSQIRTKIRQEFERHRYVSQIKTVDVLLFNSHQEFQETLNFWKQLTHVLKYFRAEEDPKARLPKNFIQGFIEVHILPFHRNKPQTPALTAVRRAGTENNNVMISQNSSDALPLLRTPGLIASGPVAC